MIGEDLIWLWISITLGVLLVIPQEAKCLLLSSEFIQTSQLEKLSA
jgi:hypothetical protein